MVCGSGRNLWHYVRQESVRSKHGELFRCDTTIFIRIDQRYATKIQFCTSDKSLPSYIGGADSFKKFQRQYLLVYLTMMMADWMQVRNSW